MIWIKQLISQALFSKCLICHKLTPELVCPECHLKIRFQHISFNHHCFNCGQLSDQFRHTNSIYCLNCMKDRCFHDIQAMLINATPVSNLINLAKLNGIPPLLSYLCNCNEVYKKSVERYYEQIDLIIPSPASFTSFIQNGMEPALLIALDLFPSYKSKIVPAFKKRLFYKQKNQTKKERKQIPSNLFTPLSNWRLGHPYIKENIKKGCSPFYGANCLIVDDIVTTGSTVNLLAEKLLRLGAKRVEGICLGATYNRFFD